MTKLTKFYEADGDNPYHGGSFPASAPLKTAAPEVQGSEQPAYKDAYDLYSHLRIKDILPAMDAVNKRLLCEAIEKYSSKEIVTLIKTMTPSMQEQFMKHDYRSMWEIWQMILNSIH